MFRFAHLWILTCILLLVISNSASLLQVYKFHVLLWNCFQHTKITMRDIYPGFMWCPNYFQIMRFLDFQKCSKCGIIIWSKMTLSLQILFLKKITGFISHWGNRTWIQTLSLDFFCEVKRFLKSAKFEVCNSNWIEWNKKIGRAQSPRPIWNYEHDCSLNFTTRGPVTS